MVKRIFGTSLLLVLAAAACSSAPSTSGGGGGNGGVAPNNGGVAYPQPQVAGATFKTQDACTLLTSSEATTAIGRPADDGTPAGDNNHSCTWGPSDGFFGLDSVEVTITDLTSYADADHPGSAAGITVKEVSGIGDAAYYTESGFVVLLEVKKGGQALEITVMRPNATTAQLEDAEKTVAQLVLSRV